MDHPVIVFSYRVVKYCNFTTCADVADHVADHGRSRHHHAELPLRVRVAARCAAVRASRQLPLAKLPAEILLKLIGTLVARPTHAAEAAPHGTDARRYARQTRAMRALEQGFHGKDFVIGCHAAEISDSGGLLFALLTLVLPRSPQG